MYCTKCGARNDEGTSFCTQCGARLSAPTGSGGAPEGDTVRLPATAPMPVRAEEPVPRVRAVDAPEPRRGAPVVPAIIVGALVGLAVVAGVLFAFDPLGIRAAMVPTDGAEDVADAVAEGGGGGDVPKTTDSPGNIANLINGGHMAAAGDGTVYYAQPIDGTYWNTRSIVRSNPDGSGKRTVYTAPDGTINLYHINVVGDRVIFNQVIEGASTVISADGNGAGHTVLDSCDDWSLCQVEDGVVYYLKDGTVRSCDLGGQDRRDLAVVGPSVLWRVAEGTIYTCAAEGGTTIWSSAIGTAERTAVYEAMDGFVLLNMYPLTGGRLITLESRGDERRVLLVAPAVGEVTQLWGGGSGVNRVCSYPDGVIITDVAPDGSARITAVAYDGSQRLICETPPGVGDVRYTCLVGDKVLFGEVGETQCRLMAVGLSGGTPWLVGDGSAGSAPAPSVPAEAKPSASAASVLYQGNGWHLTGLPDYWQGKVHIEERYNEGYGNHVAIVANDLSAEQGYDEVVWFGDDVTKTEYDGYYSPPDWDRAPFRLGGEITFASGQVARVVQTEYPTFAMYPLSGGSYLEVVADGLADGYGGMHYVSTKVDLLSQGSEGVADDMHSLASGRLFGDVDEDGIRLIASYVVIE